MPSRRELRLSPEAEDDLADILQYSVDGWEEERARAYLARLIRAFASLVDFPHLGPARDDLRAGYRCHRVEQHMIWYQIEDQAIRVNRILHIRRDAARELSD